MSNRPTYRADDRAALRAQSPSAPRNAFVVVASPVASAIGKVVPISDTPTPLSRLADDAAEDDWMSREHATARLDAGRVFVRDGTAIASGWKASANGTFAITPNLRDEQRLTSEIEVAPRHVIRTGRSLWMLVVNPAPDTQGSLLVGVSEALGHVRDELALLMAEVAMRFEKKMRVTQSLLVTGARGSGKQVVAREAHRLLQAKRGDVPFIDVPAPALADGTVGADIFGVVDKYATDVRARPGHFERAHGGVLLIDEVADLPLNEQAKLLNLLEERQVTRLGGKAPVPFDALVIAATNREIDPLVEAGEFRADLLDRIGRFRVHLPALGERPEDVLLVAQALLARHAFGGTLTWDVALELLRRPWRGNVRELDAYIERLIALARAGGKNEIDRAMCDAASRALKSTSPIQVPSGPTPATGLRGPGGGSLPMPDRPALVPNRAELLQCLIDNDWNKSEVARIYGKHARQVTRWMEYLHITRPD